MEDSAIRDGFANLRNGHDFDPLYEAAQARSWADWLVGMNGTRLFTRLYDRKLTVGRVQTPTLATLKANSANWIQEVPKRVYTTATGEKSKHQYDTGEDLPIEQFFSMSDLSEIIQYGSNWSSHFEKVFTLPSEVKKAGGKKAKTEWLSTIDKLQKNVGRANFNVTKQQREMLLEVEQLLPFTTKK